MTRLLAALLVVLLGAAGLAGAETTRVLPLRFAEAPLLAAYLGGISADAPDPAVRRRDLATRLVAAQGSRVAQGELAAAYATQADSYPQAAEGPRLPVPAGLSQAPVALPQQNALLARGTPDALDALAELLRLLDRPLPMIRVEVRLVGGGAAEDDLMGNDFAGTGNGTAFRTAGNLSGAGELLRWAVEPAEWNQSRVAGRARQRGVTDATVTTLSGVPAALRVGQLLPVFLTTVGQDAGGNRQVATQAELLFTGFELYVLPRLSGRDEVTLWLRPTVSEWTGNVTAPNGQQLPITETLLVETQVRVRSGDSLVIGGLNRVSEARARSAGGLLRAEDRGAGQRQVMLVTPTIIWPTTGDQEE